MSENPMSDTVTIDKVEFATLMNELREVSALAEVRIRTVQELETRLARENRENNDYRQRVQATFATIEGILHAVVDNTAWEYDQLAAFHELIAVIVSKHTQAENGAYVEDVNDIPF